MKKTTITAMLIAFVIFVSFDSYAMEFDVEKYYNEKLETDNIKVINNNFNILLNQKSETEEAANELNKMEQWFERCTNQYRSVDKKNVPKNLISLKSILDNVITKKDINKYHKNLAVFYYHSFDNIEALKKQEVKPESAFKGKNISSLNNQNPNTQTHIYIETFMNCPGDSNRVVICGKTAE